jgi:hypothetical protein
MISKIGDPRCAWRWKDIEMNFRAIAYAAGVIGGILLAAGPLTRTGREAPQWTRIALWMAGPAAFGWGLLGFALLSGVEDPYGYVRQFKNVFVGIAIGILVLWLFGSGAHKRDRDS